MKLVIVESPTKCHTIKQFLGSDYEVLASRGHICDLATSGKGGLGVDVGHDFKPTYTIIKDKYKIVAQLKKAKEEADEVYLATDPDREGEAISWHLANVLTLDVKATKRLEFHEITKSALKKAIENPRVINLDLVTSQETRRIIDRIMGFELSTLLKSKIHSISAGRVQSVTLKLITDRENEVKAFVPEEYYVIKATLNDCEAKLVTYMNEDITIKTKDNAENIINLLKDKEMNVISKKSNKRFVEAKPPFRTASLQQEAFNRFHFSTKVTQSIAQKLFELGLITYIRTEGVGYAEEFIAAGKKFISNKYGKEYMLSTAKYNKLQAKDNSSLAHEAIRPTSIDNDPNAVKETYALDNNSYKLYKLIYEHSLASLMTPKEEEITTVIFEANGYAFKLDGVKVVFDGYLKVSSVEKEEKSVVKNIDKFNVGDKIMPTKIEAEQHFSKGPVRYNEARLVKMMEDLGIGRPSTYAPTISTLLERDYIKSEKGILIPTEQGILTIERLSAYFPEFMDTSFTAKMEQDLDDVHANDGSREKVLNEFYNDFKALYLKAKQEMPGNELVYSGNICPKCGKPLVFRKSQYGMFEACSGFPKCKYVVKQEKAEKAEVYLDKVCPKCGKPLILRKSKRGSFYACSGFPNCHYIQGQEEKEEEKVYSDKVCPKCGSSLIIKKGKKGRGDFLACSAFPKCKYIEALKK